jgi:hypothetical protein
MDLVADLHVHTTASDGELTVPELPAAAAAAGLDCVAVTDHDRYHPALSAPVTERDGLTVVHGLELRVDAGDRRVDLLGYGVRRTEALTAELDRLQRDRIERGREMIDRVETRLGVDLDLEPHTGVGRPHVARAVAATDAPYDYGDCFDGLIGAEDPCYVPRDLPTFEAGVDLLSDACAVVALAHPFRYDDPAAALELTAHLDAVERYYPYDDPVDASAVDAAVDAHDLLVTGGSDAHDATLGRAGLDRSTFAALQRRLPRTQA